MTDLTAMGYERIKPLGNCMESWRRVVSEGGALIWVSRRSDGLWEAMASSTGRADVDDEFESAELAVKWGEETAQRLINEAAPQLAQKGME
jgi:hypothetical protein